MPFLFDGQSFICFGFSKFQEAGSLQTTYTFTLAIFSCKRGSNSLELAVPREISQHLFGRLLNLFIDFRGGRFNSSLIAATETDKHTTEFSHAHTKGACL